MKRIIFLCLALFALVAGSTYRDVLFLQNGEELRCNVVSISKSKISAKTADGDTTIKIKDVVRITMTHPRQGDEWETVDDITDSLLLAAIDRAKDADKYPGATYITLYDYTSYKFNPDSSGTATTRIIALLLTERGKGMFATHSFNFITPWQNGDVDFCRTITPDGKIYHLDDAALEFAQPNQYFPQYNLLRRIKFAPPQVSIGAIVDFQYHKSFDKVDPIHPVCPHFVFGGEEPILHKEVSVEYPSSLSENFIRYHSFAPPQRMQFGKNTKLVWQKDDIEPYVREMFMAPTSIFLPTVWLAFAVNEAKMLSSLSDSLKSSMQGSQNLDHFIDSLTTGANSPQEKFSKIYEYLNISFRKTSISPSSSRWFPRKVFKIFDDGVANSLDIDALMLYMLRRVGIDGKLLYASSIVNRSAALALSSLGFYGYPLVVANVDGKNIPCVPQRKYLPAGIVPDYYDAQTALWVGADGAQIIELPKNPLKLYDETDTFWISIAPNGDAEVQLKRVYGSKSGTRWRSYSEVRKEQEDRDFQGIAGDFNPGASLEKYSLEGINSLDSTVILEMNLSAPQLAQAAGEKLMALQLPELKYSTFLVGIPQRKTPMWFVSPSSSHRVWIIRLPQKYEPRHLPDAISIDRDSLTYKLSAKYDKNSRTITAVENSTQTDKLIPTQEYPDFRSIFFTKSKAAKNWYILQKE